MFADKKSTVLIRNTATRRGLKISMYTLSALQLQSLFNNTLNKDSIQFLHTYCTDSNKSNSYPPFSENGSCHKIDNSSIAQRPTYYAMIS